MIYNAQHTVESQSVSEVQVNDFPSKPFTCIVSCDFEKADIKELIQLAEKLVDAKAMAVAAIGENCTLFDDLVDEVFICKNIEAGDNMPHVMTTWHEDETLDEVIEFMSICDMVFKEWKISDYDLLILKISS